MESRRFEEMGRGWADTAHPTEDNQRHGGKIAGAGFSREKAQDSQKSRNGLRTDSASKTGTNLARPSYLQSLCPL